MEFLYFDTSSIWDDWYCRAGSTQGERRNLRDTSAIWSRRKLAGWLRGMLRLSAKRSRPLVGREHTLRTAIWRTSWWADISFWIDRWISSDLCERQGKTPPVCPKKWSYQASSLDMCCIRRASGKETFWSAFRSWKTWTRQKSLLGDSTPRRFSCQRTEEEFIFPFRRWISEV